MKKTIQNKFSSYQKIIKSNIETIRELVNQSTELNKLIKIIPDEESKEKIKTIKTNINKSIDELLENTDKLFHEYKALIETYEN